MIRKDEMIPMLLAACPGFRHTWDKHVAYWEDEPAGIHNDLREFVHHLVSEHERGNSAPLAAAFDLLECFLTEGESRVC